MTRRPPPAAPGRGRSGDDTGCPVLHVDMDAFYVAVELRDRPELRDAPVLVGGPGPRGVVLSASYPARRYGIHAAMPVLRARRLCPDVVVLPPRFEQYARASAAIHEIFFSVTPLVEPLALDEAFLDVRGALRRLGTPRRIGELIRARVADEQGLTCSVGVAASKFVAKLASTQAKPDGLLVVPRDEVVGFLHPLPVGALWGVGERTEEQLRRLGLRTVGDVAHTPVDTLVRALGAAVGGQLARLSWGRDARPVVPDEPERSIGAEETFPRDVDDPAVVHRELLRLATRVAARLRAAGRQGRTVSIKVRFADFTTLTRARTLREPTDVAREVYEVARGLFDALGLQRARLRLVGVRVEGLVEVGGQPRQLRFGEPTHGWADAERAADRAARRFGPGAVRPGTLLEPAAPDAGERAGPASGGDSGPAR